MTFIPTTEPQAQTPSGVNHLVINVRNMAQSHHFWSELIGLKLVGLSRNTPAGAVPMHFYSGLRDGHLHHHDLALIEARADEATGAASQTLNHIAIEYPNADSWRKQIDFLLAQGAVLHRRVERGATHSVHLHDPNGILVELVHELPRVNWEHDIEGALNQAVVRQITD